MSGESRAEFGTLYKVVISTTSLMVGICSFVFLVLCSSRSASPCVASSFAVLVYLFVRVQSPSK